MSLILFNKPPMSPLLARVLREFEAISKEPCAMDKFLASEEAGRIQSEMQDNLLSFGTCFPD